MDSFSVADGLKIDPFNGTSAIISNNMVSVGTGTGMYIGDCVEGVEVYYNTVRCGFVSSGAITVVNSVNMILKNNLMMQLANGVFTTLTYYVSNASIITDYNDHYSNGSFLLAYNFVLYVNLAEFRDSTGKEMHSVSKETQFVSDTNLHLAGTSIGDEDLVGTPISGILDDIDGEMRDPLYPYMGADEADIPLPVELASFTSIVNGRNVTLNWSTNSEINNAAFEIERSLNNSQWLKTGSVNGHGTSNSPKQYTFTDRDLSAGNYKYRLKQTDLNGSFEYFQLHNEIVIGLPQSYSLSQNYPNPFNPNTIINYTLPKAGNVKLTVYDISGKEISRLVDTKQEAGYYDIAFNGSHITSGVYFYTLESGEFVQTKRMILLK